MERKTNREVNVEEIMKEIRRKIQIEEDLNTLPAFEDIPLRSDQNAPVASGVNHASSSVNRQELAEAINYANRHYEVPYYWDMGPSTAKTFVKRVLRKIIKCVMHPIVGLQNGFNASVVRSLNGLYAGWQELQAGAEGQRNAFAGLQAAVGRQGSDLEGLKAEVGRHGSDQQELQTGLARQEAALEECRQELSSRAESQDKAIDELRNMLGVSERLIEELQSSVNCIRRVDPSIFDRSCGEQFDRYSQAGEDSIVAFILGTLGFAPKDVTYLDIGANHARYLSNTYYFYQRGAQGVLVEADPSLIPELRLLRNRDKILNKCISSRADETVDFYVMSNDGLSTKSKESVDQVLAVDGAVDVSQVVHVQTITVSQILEDYFGKAPTLMSIDVEGAEMDVLSTLDFEKYHPLVIIVETIPYDTKLVVGKKNEELISFLQDKGYTEYAFTGINSIFINQKELESINKGRNPIHTSEFDYLPDMHMNEKAAKTLRGICLQPGGIVYGPYITCMPGDYELELKMSGISDDEPMYVTITAEAGTETIDRFALANGVNCFSFSLAEKKKQLEMVISNTGDKPIELLALCLK